MIDETIEATERRCVAENGVVDVCSCLNCGMEFADKYAALAAELKELREFVGAMDHIEIGKWDGLRTDEHTFAFMTNDKYYTGTDPADAWRKMKAGEGTAKETIDNETLKT